MLSPNLKYNDKLNVNFKKGTVLTMISKNSAENTNGGNLKFILDNNEEIWLGFDKNTIKHQITLPKDTISTTYLFDKETSENYALFVGDADTYEPYKEQTLTLPITLNAVPVTTGGNVTIGGQQYVADYVDVERGKIVRMTKSVNMNDVNQLTNLSFGQHSNGVGYLAYSVDEASNETTIKDVKPLSNAYIGSQWTNESGYVYIPSVRSIIFVDDRFTDRDTAINLFKDVYVIYVMATPTEEDLTTEQINALKALKTYYPTTNISVSSEQIEGYTVFNYPISIANGWNYVKQQLNDTRDYIYDIDVQSAEAYVNSEYATALTELGV